MSASTVDLAIAKIRDAIQGCTETHFLLGKPADLDQIGWFGALLSYSWPESYLSVLDEYDGVTVDGATIFSFIQSIEILLIFRERFTSKRYWPVGSDGCGNYFVLSIGQTQDGECPVLFLDAAEDFAPAGETIKNYAFFVISAIEKR